MPYIELMRCEGTSYARSGRQGAILGILGSSTHVKLYDDLDVIRIKGLGKQFSVCSRLLVSINFRIPACVTRIDGWVPVNIDLQLALFYVAIPEVSTAHTLLIRHQLTYKQSSSGS